MAYCTVLYVGGVEGGFGRPGGSLPVGCRRGRCRLDEFFFYRNDAFPFDAWRIQITMASVARQTLFSRFRDFVYSKTSKHPKLHSWVSHEAGPMTIFFWAPTVCLNSNAPSSPVRICFSMSIPPSRVSSGSGALLPQE